MIVFFVTARASDTVSTFLSGWGRELRRKIHIQTYESLANLTELPTATMIFTDFERLTRLQMIAAQSVWTQIRTQRPELQMLNEPRRFRGRYDLLKAMAEAGDNDYRAYRLDEVGPSIQYPVFLRIENDHFGARTTLLDTREELDDAVAAAILGGVDPDLLLVIEFAGEKGPDGFYRYGMVSRFGDELFCRSTGLSSSWMVKGPDIRRGDIYSDEDIANERRFMDEPVPPLVRKAFDRAGLDYGRADFGVLRGRLQIWEVNSNPMFVPHKGKLQPERIPAIGYLAERTVKALQALDCPEPPSPGIPINLRFTDLDHQGGAR